MDNEKVLLKIYMAERLDQLTLEHKCEAEPGSNDEALREQIAAEYAYNRLILHKKVFS